MRTILSASGEPVAGRIVSALLLLSIACSFAVILLIYSDVSKLREAVVFDTVHYTKFAVGNFYVPLVVGLLSLGSIGLRWSGRPNGVARLLVRCGLLISVASTIWWAAFESGVLPAVCLNFPLIGVAVSDLRAR